MEKVREGRKEWRKAGKRQTFGGDTPSRPRQARRGAAGQRPCLLGSSFRKGKGQTAKPPTPVSGQTLPYTYLSRKSS